MSRKEFAVWLACLLLITLGAAVLCVWMLPGCAPLKVADSIEVGVGHSKGDLDWSNSQRSADTQSNSVWLSVHPFAGAFDEPRAPVWGDLHYPREWPDPEREPPANGIADKTTAVVTSAHAPEPAPPAHWGATEWSTFAATILVALIGLWQRKSIATHVRTISNKVKGHKPKETE